MSSRRPGDLHWLDYVMRPAIALRAAFHFYRTGNDGAAEALVAWATQEAIQRTNRYVGRRIKFVERRANLVAKFCGKARALIDRARAALGRLYPVGLSPRANASGAADVVTIDQARDEQTFLRQETLAATNSGSELHTTTKSKGWLRVAHSLLVVDLLALFYVLTSWFNVSFVPLDPIGLTIAAAFSIFGAGVQALLAHQLGHQLWSRRNAVGHLASTEPKPRLGVVVPLVAALAAVSLGAAVTIAVRVLHEISLVDGSTSLGLPIALMLASCALISPWIITVQLHHDGSAETRRIKDLGRVITYGRAQAEKLLDAASDRISRAEKHHAAMITRRGRLAQGIEGIYGEQALFLRLLFVLRARAGGTGTSADLVPPLFTTSDAGAHLVRVDEMVKSSMRAITEVRALLNDRPSDDRPEASEHASTT